MTKSIKSASCVLKEDRSVPVEALSAQERQDLSRWLRETYLRELLRGKAEVSWEADSA